VHDGACEAALPARSTGIDARGQPGVDLECDDQMFHQFIRGILAFLRRNRYSSIERNLGQMSDPEANRHRSTLCRVIAQAHCARALAHLNTAASMVPRFSNRGNSGVVDGDEITTYELNGTAI